MGCGAGQIIPIIPIQTLQNKIRKKLITHKNNKILNQRQCKIILLYIQQRVIPLYDEYNPAHPSNHLISQFERIIWKIMLFTDKDFIFNGVAYKQSPIANTQRLLSQFQQVSKDIHRTYSEKLNQQQKKQLSIVLKNICIYYPNLGYTQGMNFYVGFFLLCGFKGQQAFWLFIALSKSKNYFMIMNFSDGFPMTMHMVQIFQSKLRQYFPKIEQKFKRYAIDPHFYVFSWFLCYFLYPYEPNICAKIWSYIIRTENISCIVSIGLGILSKYYERILKQNQFEKIMQILRCIKIEIDQKLILEIIEESKKYMICNEDFFKESSQITKLKFNPQYFEDILFNFTQVRQTSI